MMILQSLVSLSCWYLDNFIDDNWDHKVLKNLKSQNSEELKDILQQITSDLFILD